MKKGRLYTIGYGNRTQEDFYSVLQLNSIKVLIDVRTKPYSRFRPQFNKNRLCLSSPANGIEYIFKGEALGGLLLNDATLYKQGIEFLSERLKSGHNVTIMCCELDYTKCHRYKIAEDIFQRGYTVIHIGKKNEPIIHQGLLF